MQSKDAESQSQPQPQPQPQPQTNQLPPHHHPQMNYAAAAPPLPHYVPPHLRVQQQHQQGSGGGAGEENRWIWVGDLLHWMDEAYLKDCFGSTNEIASIKVIRNKQTQLSEGYGFVEFFSHSVAEKVLQSYSGILMPNTEQPFRLNWATFSSGDKRADNGSDFSIFVGDLAADVTDSLLLDTFASKYPSVKAAKVVFDVNTGRSKGYGFVKFGDDGERFKAMTEMNGEYCSSRPMRIVTATPRKSSGYQQHSSQGGFSSNSPSVQGMSDGESDTTIFVGGLDPNVSVEDLRQPFSEFGEILSVKILTGKGHGFVQYANQNTAEKALQKLNGSTIGKQTVQLSLGRNPAKKQVVDPPSAVLDAGLRKLRRPSPSTVNRDLDAVWPEISKRPHKIGRWTPPRKIVQFSPRFRPGRVDISQPVMLDSLSCSSADSDRGGAADAGESMEYHHVEIIDNPQNATGEQDMSLNQDSDFISNPLIGVRRKVEEVESLLQVGGSDIRTVGIYGTGGIGKTSLAKLVFNRISTHFQGCSFLQHTREQFGGLEILQTKLMSEILRRECTKIGSSDEGICYIREVLCDMRVLVVLDNVDSGFCLDRFVGGVDSFGPGSRIIVIARSKTDLPKCTGTYEVLKMNDQEAFKLFTTHAFKGSTSSCRVNLCDVNHVLSQKILCAIGRIPLAVEVIGSLLSGEPVDEWGSTLVKLEDFPDEELQRRLTLSYDALSDQQKKIFLDVACFVNGEDSRISSYMWRESEGDTVLSEGLKDLVSLSLVKIGDNNELLMHDELRELGRELVCQEELSGTEKMNRFLIQVRDFAALLAEKDLGRVEALSLSFDKRSHYQDSDFRKMPSLRFLKMADANMCGDFSDVFTNLRWLHWEGCPRTLKATNFCLKSLVILNLSWSKVTSTWEGWSQIKAANSLKVLNLTGCMNLITTPNLSYLPNLERLILEQCSSLVRIDPSIQCLEKLQFLNLKFCTELNVLPKELGSLKALTEILIDGTSIRDIPISIGHLVSLKTLSASSCVSLTHLPGSISYLTSLSELTLDGAQIHELPDLIGELKILGKLSLKDCRWMQKLPDSIGKLKDSLIELDVSGTGISEFPNSIQDLQRLKVLRMNSCFIRVFPKAICYLSNLEELHASHCMSLESDVPPEIERLRSLKILRVGFSQISSLPLSICNLPRLQNLDLDYCNMLSMVPRLPSCLSRLCFNSRIMVKFPDLSHNLEELILGDYSDSEELLIHKTDFEGKYFWIPGLPKLKAMELRHSGIVSIHGGKNCSLLQKLTLSCTNLEFISLDPLPLLTLSVHHCRSLKILYAGSFQCLVELQVLDSAVRRITGLWSLKALRLLKVSKCQIEGLPGLEILCSLVRLTVSHCENLRELPNLSRSLRSLSVSYCDSLESLPNLSKLEMLKELEIHCCKKLTEIHGLEDLKSLEKLQVTECEAANLPKVGEFSERLL